MTDKARLPINMTEAEKDRLRRLVADVGCYLEYGCGDSTLIAVELGCDRIVSVETDVAWIDRLRDCEPFATAISEGRLYLEHADIGQVGGWGYPIDDGAIRHWPKYALTPFLRHEYLYDVILVDGRFRLATALVAFHFMKPDTTLVIHDYVNRQHYHEVEKFFIVEEVCDTLAVMRKKSLVINSSLCYSLLNSILDPR